MAEKAVADFKEYHSSVRPDNLDPFRDYEAPGPAEIPRAVFADIELLSATYPLRIFTMRSVYPLETVITPGYFDNLSDCRLRRLDKIELLADAHGEGTFATLAVDSVNKAGGEVRVSLLCKYERQH
jgi:hypothetical protein